MRRAIVDWLEPLLGRDLALALAPGWFTFVGLAAIVAGLVALSAARRSEHDSALVLRTIAWGYAAAVLGGIVGPALWHALERAASGDGLAVRWAGMTSWSGFVAAACTMAWVWRRGNGGSLASLADLLVVPAGLALAVARLGCLVAGCDYGKVSSLPWAVRFPAGSPAWRYHVDAGWLPASRDASLPVHPTQLYEAALGLALVALALIARRSPWVRERAGRLACLAVLGYAAGRWGVESLRDDAGRGFLGPLSTGQVAAVALAAWASWLLWRSRRRVVGAAAAVVTVLAVLAAPASAQPGEPVDPYAAPSTPTPPAPASPAPADEATGFSVGGMLGIAVPMNRRADQIPQLGGASLSAVLDVGGGAGVGVDLDSLANDVATHRSILVSGELRRRVGPRIGLGARFGVGLTSIDFADAAFTDQVSLGIRGSLTAEVAIGERWALMVWPLTVDLMGEANVGGPITTYQMRLGVAYRSRALSSLGSPP